jgi:nicotinamidase/pyrazinamidase
MSQNNINTNINICTDTSALIICNLQNDFCEGGPVSIQDSLKIIPIINRIRNKFNTVIFIKSWYPDNHTSFEDNGIKHCIQNTKGAELNPGILFKDTDYTIHIGTLALYDSSSGFYNAKTINKESNLNNILIKEDIQNLYICGISIEGSIFSTIMDAVNMRYKCYLVEDASIGKDNVAIEKCYKYMNTLDVKIVKLDVE